MISDTKKIVKMVDSVKSSGDSVVLKNRPRQARVKAMQDFVKKPRVIQKK